MKTIKEILDSLKDQDRNQLLYAFNNQIPQHIEYEPGKYIGVHTSNDKNLSIESCAGSFYTGSIINKPKEVK